MPKTKKEKMVKTRTQCKRVAPDEEEKDKMLVEKDNEIAFLRQKLSDNSSLIKLLRKDGCVAKKGFEAASILYASKVGLEEATENIFLHTRNEVTYRDRHIVDFGRGAVLNKVLDQMDPEHPGVLYRLEEKHIKEKGEVPVDLEDLK